MNGFRVDQERTRELIDKLKKLDSGLPEGITWPASGDSRGSGYDELKELSDNLSAMRKSLKLLIQQTVQYLETTTGNFEASDQQEAAGLTKDGSPGDGLRGPELPARGSLGGVSR